MTTTVRVSDETHARLAALSASTGRRMGNIIDDAISTYESTEFWRAFKDGYDVLAADSATWGEVHIERDGEAPTLTDNLD